MESPSIDISVAIVDGTFHSFLLVLCTLCRALWLTSHSAILSTTESEEQKIAYVKGGLFTKSGIELPPPGAEIFWNRREKWEEPTKGVAPQ